MEGKGNQNVPLRVTRKALFSVLSLSFHAFKAAFFCWRKESVNHIRESFASFHRATCSVMYRFEFG